MIGKLKKENHNGVDYFNYCTGKKFNGVFAFAEERKVLNGELRVSLTKGSYKFGDELQLRILSHKSDTKLLVNKRNPSNWDTIEINLPVSELDNLIFALQELKTRVG